MPLAPHPPLPSPEVLAQQSKLYPKLTIGQNIKRWHKSCRGGPPDCYCTAAGGNWGILDRGKPHLYNPESCYPRLKAPGLDPLDIRSYIWVDPDEPGYQMQKHTRNLEKHVLQIELITLKNIQRISLEPVEFGWPPWTIGHRMSRNIVNRVKFYGATDELRTPKDRPKRWEGKFKIKLTGEVDYNWGYYHWVKTLGGVRKWREERGFKGRNKPRGKKRA